MSTRVLASLVLLSLTPASSAQDPCAFSELLASDGAQHDKFGRSVSYRGNLALVGSSSDDDLGPDSGSAYVFRRTTSGWVQEQKLLPSPGAGSLNFGTSVALGTERLAVGAVRRGAGLSGGAFVFRFDATFGMWVQEAELALPGPGPASVTLEIQGDDELFVSDPQALSPIGGGGVVMEFRRVGTSWTGVQPIFAPDGLPGDFFGRGLEVDGDVLVVGAPFSGGIQEGSAYVYRRSPVGIWSLEEKLLPANPILGGTFGTSCALDGAMLAVSAPRLLNAGPGRVHLRRYDPPTMTWPEEQVLQENVGTVADEFGRGLALEGPLLVVGAPTFSLFGSIYAYHYSETTQQWVDRGQRFSPRTQHLDWFGYDVSLFGGFAFGGAPGFTSGSDKVGAAFGTDLWACDGVGASYCGPANPSSSGDSARILATGSAVAVGEPLFLTALDLPLDQFGYFLASTQQGFVANPGGSQGNLCLGLPIGRFNRPEQIGFSEDGFFSLAIDTGSIPLSPPVAIQVGETWNFQAWFRDLNPGATSNFTDGVEVLFQ